MNPVLQHTIIFENIILMAAFRKNDSNLTDTLANILPGIDLISQSLIVPNGYTLHIDCQNDSYRPLGVAAENQGR